MSALALLAAQGLPPSSPMAKMVVPLGALIFLGSIYLLVRSNLGTRRGYYMFATAFFGFMVIQSAFWAWGAPGTPVATGPTNLPGQVPNEYQPTWFAFAEGSRLYDEEFSWVQQAEFGEVPEDFEDVADAGVGDIQAFFADEEHGQLVKANWVPVEVGYAEQDFPVLEVTYAEADQAGEPEPGGDRVTLYGFYDAGAASFPAFLFLLVSLALFVLHAFLLDRDEQREKRELRELAGAEREPEPELAQA